MGKREVLSNKSKNVIESFKFALAGIWTTIKNERNIRIHFSVMILVIIFGIVFNLELIEWAICVVLFVVVLAGEMLNTAIENVVDLASPEINEKAKIAKDVAAGAELILAIGSAIVGLIIFIPKIF